MRETQFSLRGLTEIETKLDNLTASLSILEDLVNVVDVIQKTASIQTVNFTDMSALHEQVYFKKKEGERGERRERGKQFFSFFFDSLFIW